MNEPRMTLRDLVRQALASRDASGRQLASLASEHGFKMTGTTLNHIAAGTYKHRPSETTLRGIAWLAGVPEEVAFTAAGVPMPGPPFSDELPPGVDNLTPRSRRAAIEVLRALVEAEQKAGGRDAQSDTAPMNERVTHPTGSDKSYGLAAMAGQPGNPPDTTTGEESQLPPEDDEAP